MAARHRANPLALAILCCLHERPMHPYEVAQTLRSRAKHESIRLNYGSLYSVVDGLARRELIEPVETRRDGRRPERTVYAITELGQRELTDWLSELVVTPAKEYPQFEAALSLLCGLAPDDALALLRQRVDALTMRLTQSQAARKAAHEYGLPRLFDLEGEYADALMRAELEFVEKLVTDLEGGTLEGVDEWRGWYSNESGHRQWFPSEEGSS